MGATHASPYALTRSVPSPMIGTESTKLRQRSSELARLCESAAPHHIVVALLDAITHRRLAITATPTSGTRTAKYGGNAARRSGGISTRIPSALTFTMPDGRALAVTTGDDIVQDDAMRVLSIVDVASGQVVTSVPYAGLADWSRQ